MDDALPPAKGDPVALGRRGFVTVAAIGGSAALLGCPAGEPGQDEPRLGDLAAGSVIERWTIVAVHPVRHGAIPVVMQTERGERFQLDVMAHDPALPAVATSDRFDVFVANAGDGHSATDEEQGLGAIALARALRERERAGLVLPELWTMAQRSQRAPDGSFRVPLG